MSVATRESYHVLAVDDSLIDRKLIERLLKTSSYQVTTVDSGSKALELLGIHYEQTNPPSTFAHHHQEIEVNLVITDYCMPEMTGYDLLKKIKESSVLKDIPVVIMSSENVPSRINRCIEGGAEEFFLKPVQLSDLKRLRPHLLKTKLKDHHQQKQINGGFQHLQQQNNQEEMQLHQQNQLEQKQMLHQHKKLLEKKQLQHQQKQNNGAFQHLQQQNQQNNQEEKQLRQQNQQEHMQVLQQHQNLQEQKQLQHQQKQSNGGFQHLQQQNQQNNQEEKQLHQQYQQEHRPMLQQHQNLQEQKQLQHENEQEQEDESAESCNRSNISYNNNNSKRKAMEKGPLSPERTRPRFSTNSLTVL